MADQGLARARQQEYQKLFDEVGAIRFEMAVTNCIRQHSTGFFPSMGEFMNYVPTSERKELSVCELCKDSSGYVIKQIMVSGKFRDVATKCSHGRE